MSCRSLAAVQPQYVCVLADTDECEWEDACAQHCHNSRGSFACGCAPGYTLHADRRDCVPVNGKYSTAILLHKICCLEQYLRVMVARCAAEPVTEPLSLIVVTGGDVRRAWPDGAPRTRNHSLPALNVRAIDFLYDNRYLRLSSHRTAPHLRDRN